MKAWLVGWMGVLLYLGGSVAMAGLPQEPRPPAGEYYRVTFALGEDYPRSNPAAYEAHFRMLRDLHIDALRISVAWNDYEPARGQFDWARLDDFIELAVDRYGLSLMIYVWYFPSWATVGGGWKDPVRYVADFGHFVYTLVDRYKGRVSHWMIGNEQDHADFWLGTPEEFAALLEVGVDAVRRADPEALVAMGGITSMGTHKAQFVRAVAEATPALGQVDFTSVHAYYETWHPDPVEQLYNRLLEYAAMIEPYVPPEAQVWVDEMGYSDYVRPDGRGSDWYAPRHDYEKTRPYQAEYFNKAILRLMATEIPTAIAWYRIRDLDPGLGVIGDENNHHLGIVDVTGFPKPIYYAIARTRALFDQPVRVVDDRLAVRSERGTFARLVSHAYEREDGSLLIAGWREVGGEERAEVRIAGLHRGVRAVVAHTATGIQSVYEGWSWSEDGVLTLRDVPFVHQRVTLWEVVPAGNPKAARLTWDVPSVQLDALPGSQINVKATVTNVGDAPSGAFEVALRPDRWLHVDRAPAEEQSPLAPGESRTLSWDLYVPLALTRAQRVAGLGAWLSIRAEGVYASAQAVQVRIVD